MWKRIKVVADAYQVVRPVSLSVIAIFIVACVMPRASTPGRTAVMIAAIVAIAGLLVLQVHWAVTHLHRQSRDARHSAAEAEKHYVEVLRRIITFVEGRDKYWSGHSQNVGRLAGQVAGRLGLSPDKCTLLELAGQLHDIGLLAVPEAVIKSHSRFGIEDLRSMQTHSQVSYEVLKPLELLAEVLPAVRYHHERLNGTGYPDGLAEGDVPLEARILAVADAYDAMTHDRPHRRAMGPLAAMREMRRCCPSGYDSDCVAALSEVLNIPALEETEAAAYPISAACAALAAGK